MSIPVKGEDNGGWDGCNGRQRVEGGDEGGLGSLITLIPLYLFDSAD